MSPDAMFPGDDDPDVMFLGNDGPDVMFLDSDQMIMFPVVIGW